MLYLAQSGSQNPLVPNLTELITGLIAFFIVFGALAKMLLPRIQTTLAERTDAIEGGLKRAEDAQTEAAKLLDQYRKQLNEARQEASRLREQGQAEYARLTAAAQAQIENEKQQALTSLRAEIGALSVELASRVVGESLENEARQRRTVDRFLEQLEEQAGTAEVKANR